ncbi:glycosyltransferase [Okeania sp.]|uniref:glycosyltransferase n=1 Tax=Okeania sp. TaxID=3100323 RepID=UPI002B4AF104|nr:glycosyltransferase [Okeania sp.]MEB3342545.1 glycosyltransferase [Okeania sp.]
MSLISVIIPAYNSEKTIQETIESVIKQTFSDWELIIINDDSQDRTVEVVSQIKDPRIKLFSYQNAGAPASRNRGFNNSVGQFIAFLDADDLWTPDKLESQLNALQSHPEAAVAYSWTDYIDKSGNLIKHGGRVVFNGDVYSELLVRNFLENGSNPLIKREAINDIGGFDESLKGGQDWELYLRLGKKYHFVAVEKPQILYRFSTNSISSNALRQGQECLKVIESAFERAPASLQHLKKQSLANIYKYLTCKTIDSQPTPKKGLIVMKFILLYALNDPYLKSDFRLIFAIFVKSLGFIFLPPILYKKLLGYIKSISTKNN